MISLTKLLHFDITEANFQVRREQVRARIAMYPRMLSSQLVVAVLLIAVLWDEVAHPLLLGWFGLVACVHLFEFTQWRSARNLTESIELCRKWDMRFKLHTSLGSAAWGVGWTVMFVQGDLDMQSLIICVAIGLSSGAVTINPVHRPAFFIYLTFLLTPLIVLVGLGNDEVHWFLVVVLVIYLAFLIESGIKLMQTFETSLRQRFENDTLLQSLRIREEEIEKALSVAEQANTTKSKFLATASHDLRQPLQALRLFSEALQNVTKEPESQKLSEQIGKSVNSLVEMFDDLLDVSRLDAGIIQPRLQHFELFGLFDRLHVDFAPIAQSKGLILELPYCGGKRGVSTWCSAVVYSDPFLLERILRNLLSNAIRYTEKGKVHVSCECTNGAVAIAVNDTGVGMNAETLEKIFEEYFQADNPHRDRRKGLGLGLAIVRRMQELLGYQIKVKSQVGVGSTFSFSLPHGDRAELAKPFNMELTQEDVSGKIVVLVEDDADIREFTTELLQSWGCAVVAGVTGQSVMQDLEKIGTQPDILVCDYRLPDKETAIDVMCAMHQRWPELPVLVLTGDTGTDTLRAIQKTGATLLHKPIAPSRLRTALHFSLSAKRERMV